MSRESLKVLNDPVHGQIKLHPLLVKIINTPEFGRLRFIKQLGGVYYVYPGAAHNRFEHSIGVCHLAGEFARKLQKDQTELLISDKDVLCVEIAALCHDLGHGPFSHLFDQMVIPKICESEKWKTHEEISLAVFDCIVERLQLDFDADGLNNSDDIRFIKELINGPPKGEKCIGRPPEKHFLYEIVSNKISGIDVDKWDYFTRDCLMLGMKSSFRHTRAIEFSRVLIVKGLWRICYRDKVARPLYDMFSVRDMIHRSACYHKVATAVQIMIADAIIAAETSKHDDFKLRGKDGTLLTMAEAVEKMDMIAYQQMTDEILMRIYNAKSPGAHEELLKAQRLAERVLTRDLYQFVGSILFKGTDHYTDEKLKKTLEEMKETFDERPEFYQEMLKKVLKKEMDDIVDRFQTDPDRGKSVKDNFVAYPVVFTFGQKTAGPLENVWFFRKNEPDKAIQVPREEISNFLPTVFSEPQVFVYCKEKSYFDDVKQAFNVWYEEKTRQL